MASRAYAIDRERLIRARTGGRPHSKSFPERVSEGCPVLSEVEKILPLDQPLLCPVLTRLALI
jgi:hypothetical protein